MGRVVAREACPECQKKGRDNKGDNLARYADGSAYCHSCSYFEPAAGKDGKAREVNRMEKSSTTVAQVEGLSSVKALPERGISYKIAERYGVRVSVDEQTGENAVHYYPYFHKGKLVGYKQRRLPKAFSSIGSMSDVGLFGQQIYEGNNRKLLILTEGEIDCLSVAEILENAGKEYAVCSVQNGADAEGTIKAPLRAQAEFFASFEKVIICFDNDGPGEVYAQAVADWLCTITKVGIMPVADHFGEFKDVNDLLCRSGTQRFWSAFKNTKEYQPESIVKASSISLEKLKVVPEKGFAPPWPELAHMLQLRKGELTVVCAGPGLGKTTFIRELTACAGLEQGAKIGVMSLEDPVDIAMRQYIALDCSVPHSRLMFNPNCVTPEQYEHSYHRVADEDRFVFFDSSRYLDFDALMNKVQYFAKSINCDFLVIDNLTLVAARSSDNDERRAIDAVMASLAAIVTDTGCGIILVNHLNRNNKKSPNNGDMVTLQDLRGSGSIDAFAWNVWALERNQQSEDEVEKNKLLVRILKNRTFGRTGVAGYLQYNPDTGRLIEPSVDF